MRKAVSFTCGFFVLIQSWIAKTIDFLSVFLHFGLFNISVVNCFKMISGCKNPIKCSKLATKPNNLRLFSMKTKPIILAILLNLFSCIAFGQSGTIINDAEKKAIGLIRPVDFAYGILTHTSAYASLSSHQQLVLMQKLDKQLYKARKTLIQNLSTGAFTYVQGVHYTDSIKNAFIAKINALNKGELESLCEAEHAHEHDTKAPTRAPGGPCLNPNFESCNFSDWEMFTGTVPYPSTAPYSFTSPTPTTSFSTVSAAGSGTDQHYITNGGTDAIGGFPMVYPGGTCSAEIGDFTGTGNGASQIKKTFLVSSGDAILTLNYAVCLDDAGHTPEEQPYFRMRVYDAFGNSITCAQYEAVAGDGQPGWVTSGTWQYKPWSTVFIPLAPYIGQNVTVEFTVGDCAQGGHAGYAYVDASCDAMAFNMSASAVCAGSPISISAPSGADSYLWSTGATTQTISVSTPGTYSVVVTPVTGSACSITLDTTVTVSPNPVANFSDDAPVCVGTPVNFTDLSTIASGGTITSWSWTFGDGGTSALPNPTYTYAAAGTYNVTLTVSTANGCTHSITLPVTINAGSLPVITAAGPFCSTDPVFTATASAGGGTWSATCGACINATTGAFDPSLATLGNNTITYSITGACSGSDTEVFNVQEVTIDNVVSTNIDCFGNANGTITITATGATQYSIDNGTSFFGTGSFTGLGPNTYPILVENAIGCQATSTVTITEPPLLTITAGTLANVSCFGLCDGEVAALPGGGTPPLNVDWTGSATGTGLSLTGVCLGTYTATVTDGNGCTATDVTNVTEPTPVIITAIATTPEFCPGDCQGTIDVTASGGTGALQYSINSGSSFQAATLFINVCTGAYNVVVEDANGCQATGTTSISPLSPLSVTPSPDVTVCIGQTTTISATTAGGTGVVNLTWDNGLPPGPSNVVDPAGTTTYTVTATDANGCAVSGSVTVTENPPLAVNAFTDQTICPGASAAISASASGGNGGPYTYTWTNNQDGTTLTGANQTVSPGAATVYTVTVTDNCGTPSASDIVTIGLYPLPAVNYTIDTNQGCTPVVVNFSNTTNPALTGTCFWDFGDGSTSTNCDEQHVFTAPGCYDISLTVTTINGCVVDTTILSQICVFPFPIADFTFGPIPADVFDTEINFTNTTIGGNTYDWDFAGLGTSTAINPVFTFPNTSGGIYPVCLTAENTYGCIDTTCHNVIIGGEFLLYVPNAFTPDGDGINDLFLPILQGEEPETFEFFVFNRWGELIYYSNNKLIGWDGTHEGIKSKEDVYVWKVKVESSIDHEKKEFLGHATLLR